LGFGLMTAVAPANAATIAASGLTAGTSSPSRVGIVSKTTITVAHTATAINQTDTIAIAAKVTSAPALSTLTTDTHTATKGITLSGTATLNTGATGGTATNAYVVGGANATLTQVNTTTAKTSTSFTLEFVADKEGTYTILVSAGSSSFTAGDKTVAVTITTAGAPTTLSVSTLGAVVDNATYGARMSVTLKDANGNATVLGQNEAIDITSTTNSAITLSPTSLGQNTTNYSGVYYVTATDGGTIKTGADTVTFSGSGLLPATFSQNTSLSTYAAVDPVAADTFDLDDATGYVGTTSPYKSNGSSHTLT